MAFISVSCSNSVSECFFFLPARNDCATFFCLRRRNDILICVKKIRRIPPKVKFRLAGEIANCRLRFEAEFIIFPKRCEDKTLRLTNL